MPRAGDSEHGSPTWDDPTVDPLAPARATEPPRWPAPSWPPPPAWPPPQSPPPGPPGTWAPPGYEGGPPRSDEAGEQEPAGEGGPFLDRPGTPPRTKSDAGFWLLMGLAGFAIGQVVGAVFVAIAAALAGESSQIGRFATMAAPPEWYVGTSLVGLWVGFFAGPWIAAKARGTGRALRDLGVRFKPVDLAGVLIGVGAQFVLDALYAPFVTHLKHFTAPTQRLVGASHGWGYAAIAFLTVVGAPFFEEVLFRGLGLKALARLFAPRDNRPSPRRAVGVAGAVVVDGVLFGLAHWELYQFAGLAVFGMVLAFISYRTGRLGMNMVAHASFNLVAVLAVLGTSGGVLH